MPRTLHVTILTLHLVVLLANSACKIRTGATTDDAICDLLTKQRLIEVIDIFVYHFDKFCLIGFIYLTNSVYHSFQNNVHVPATEQADEIKSLYEKQHCAKQKQGKMEVIEEFFRVFFYLFIYLFTYLFFRFICLTLICWS